LQTFIQSTQEATEKKVNPIGIFLDLKGLWCIKS
jgi:hypothetical protein